MPMRRAHFDPLLRATILSRRPLRYREGADLATDRPAHLRAGSSLCWFGDRLAVVQDDANFIALVDPATGLAEAVTLPSGEGGLRQFDDGRGNKKFKLDLEACCVLEGPTGSRIIAFGSGSKKRRRQVALVDGAMEGAPRVTLVEATALYERLEGTVEFAGSDMNIEGAVVVGDVIRLFGRGNGEPRRGRLPLNATCDLSVPVLLAYLAAPADVPAPLPGAIGRYELGDLDGLPLGFTDAAVWDDRMLYTAAAEDSADASVDGLVTGSVLGILPAAGSLRSGRLYDAAGTPTNDKIEGVASMRGVTDRVYVVVDGDDAGRASELCEVHLEGAWRSTA